MSIKNIALAISIFGFVIGFSEIQENMFFWLGKPVGAIAFILYFICMVLEKEYAIMDTQTGAQEKSSGVIQKETCAPALTKAHSH